MANFQTQAEAEEQMQLIQAYLDRQSKRGGGEGGAGFYGSGGNHFGGGGNWGM